MGYFSNSTEGLDYQHQYCRRCQNHRGPSEEEKSCPIWDVHLMFNYDECNNPESFLGYFIPRNGLINEQCNMFREEVKP